MPILTGFTPAGYPRMGVGLKETVQTIPVKKVYTFESLPGKKGGVHISPAVVRVTRLTSNKSVVKFAGVKNDSSIISSLSSIYSSRAIKAKAITLPTVLIKAYKDADGDSILEECWTLKHVQFKNLAFGDLDYSSSDVFDLEATIDYFSIDIQTA